MAYLTLDDVFNVLANEIKARFPDVLLGFAGKAFPGEPELWVYVLDRSRMPEVEKFCRELEARPTDPPLPVRILTKTWTGRPIGETEDDLRRKRDEFIRRHGQATH